MLISLIYLQSISILGSNFCYAYYSCYTPRFRKKRSKVVTSILFSLKVDFIWRLSLRNLCLRSLNNNVKKFLIIKKWKQKKKKKLNKSWHNQFVLRYPHTFGGDFWKKKWNFDINWISFNKKWFKTPNNVLKMFL